MSKKQNIKAPLSLFEKWENHLHKNERLYFWVIFGVTALIAALLYDPRISLSGDDSAYILAANSFIKDFSFPGFQGPLYPIVLSSIVAIFGIALLPLKLFSLLSILGFMYLTFRAFRRRIPYSLLLPVLALVAVNSYVLYYASQTFSEAFYMFVQAGVLLCFFRYVINEKTNQLVLRQKIKPYLWVALTVLALCLSRSVGFSFLIAGAGYFLFYKEWKHLGLFLLIFTVVFVAYSLIKNDIWHNSELQFSGQGSMLLNKDPYRAELGKEDFAGLLVRFWQNSTQYLSNGLLRIMGFHCSPEYRSIVGTLLIYALSIGGLIYSYKRSRYLFFTILTAGAFLIVTFIVLQVFWNQERLIIPVYPYILLTLLGCLYYFLQNKRALQFLYFIPIIILFISGFSDTVKTIPQTRKLKNEYSGLTPDWVNYMKAGNWAAKNLKETDIVACRKPSISTVYGNGKSFYGIYSVPTGNAKAFLQEWMGNPDKYVAVVANEQSFNYYHQWLRNYYRARIEMGNGAFWALNHSSDLDNILAQNNIQSINVQQFKEISTQTDDNFGIFYADSLLNQLKTSHVTHIMTASLRINPNMKTEQTISTVERYAFYIQEKYPIIYEFVYQEGSDENEPAKIYKINWDVVNEK
jgi:hypothetical protein